MLRNRITWRPARRVDAVGGAVVGTVAVLVAVWLLGSVVDRGDLPPSPTRCATRRSSPRSTR